ncbi:GNAT family N-acetyltransferase [Saccharopolyspora sp. NFXS83]|uniref:GNAT family N-acetyltransferase n=1 Tax=Saccharopolyspora sp. NFXS83 TaxID=2993560 RepID=UPI00224A49A5|nr:GNAT family N-acetyltransferase [Saccharopolyspora sp. NFXS83]MCX2731648.1 GNAT family N-acetyltransferase [Saccharopolyspora sp. NFXS83]
MFPRPSLDAPVFTEPTLPENVLVAVENARPLGFAKLVPSSLAHPKIGLATAHVQVIYGCSVAPEHQGRDVGTALLHAIRRESVARGARRITLKVLGSNPRAQTLYHRHGYRVEGILRGEFFLQGNYVDDVLMALDLSAAA